MIKKTFKGRVEKRKLSKNTDVCRFYNPIQSKFADMLEADSTIVSFQVNVLLTEVEDGMYMTDFLCKKKNGELMVRECANRELLNRPRTAHLLQVSKTYWLEHGVDDWGIVVNAKE